MSGKRPKFKKKELALSSSTYFFIPSQICVYSVEVTHRDPVNGELLQQAVNRTLKRMPYMADTFEAEGKEFWYAENPLPMEAAHFHGPRRVGGEETNYHMIDVTYDDHTTWFSMFHGFCEGIGLNFFIESTLYHYYCLKDGTDYEPNGIRNDKEEMGPAEEKDPVGIAYEIDPEFVMPKPSGTLPYHLPELTGEKEDTVYDYGINLRTEDLLPYVKGLQTSPSVLISLIVGEAILRVHPDADAPIAANIPLSGRKMLDCLETFKNCAYRAVLPITGSPMDAMPFEQKAAAMRNVLKMQLNPNILRAAYNYAITPKTMERLKGPGDYWEVTTKNSGFVSVNHNTFYTDYIGSFHTTGYSDQITGIHFLCKPPMGTTMQLNIIENNGVFQINCLACEEISVYVDAILEVMHEHGLKCERGPVRQFVLPRTQWRDSMGL